MPGGVIRDSYATLPITTADGSVQSVASGNWTMANTWVCGQVPNVIHDVTINSGNAVQLNNGSEAKSLNINGILDLSTINSTINIKNN